jgi:alkaline phosphatase D
LDDARFSESESDWSEASTGSFTTASENGEKSRTLVIGSCRYLLKTFLGDFFDDRGDKTFRSILRQMDDDGVKIDQLIMMGDQIYADDLSALNPDKTVDQFYKRYREAFSQEYIRRLMSRTPTYMTLDDHEIEDNWPTKAVEKDWKTLFPVAIHAYQSYQLSHSPRIPVTRRRLVGTPNALWYKYEDGCVDVFVTDSRTERFIDDHANREMLGREQMSALKRWLKNGSERVKLVVTSVPFFPDTTGGEKGDKWSGFQDQRKEILTHIEKHAIHKVVFLSGDVHASLAAQLESPTGTKIHSVVSSAFFWPYPHPSARHFQRQGAVDGGKAGKFTLSTSKIISDDNFTRLTVTPVDFTADVFARKGSLKDSVTYEF